MMAVVIVMLIQSYEEEILQFLCMHVWMGFLCHYICNMYLWLFKDLNTLWNKF